MPTAYSPQLDRLQEAHSVQPQYYKKAKMHGKESTGTRLPEAQQGECWLLELQVIATLFSQLMSIFFNERKCFNSVVLSWG
jgi:hypothetical protein